MISQLSLIVNSWALYGAHFTGILGLLRESIEAYAGSIGYTIKFQNGGKERES